MAQWSELPREIQVEIIKFAIADVLQYHIDRVPPGVYWGAYPSYIDFFNEGASLDIRDDPDHYDADDERDIHTTWGDGCEIEESHESSRFTSLLVVNKTFLTPHDLKNILLRCGHVNCSSPQHLSQFKDNFTSMQRQKFRVMWVRPQNIPLIDNMFPLFGPDNGGLNPYRCLLYFPNLKLINLQLEQYLTAEVGVCCKTDFGRLERPTECQNILDCMQYKTPGSHWYMAWVRDLLSTSVVLNGKVELRLSFEANIPCVLGGQKISPPVAMFSSKDFCVRLHYEGDQWVIKQHTSEQFHREGVIKRGKRSSFEELPGGLRALISAKSRDWNSICGTGQEKDGEQERRKQEN